MTKDAGEECKMRDIKKVDSWRRGTGLRGDGVGGCPDANNVL